MKKILTFALLLVTVIVSGCGDKTADKPAPESDVDAVLVAGSFFVIESENMSYLTDAIARKDTEYLNQLMLEGKVFKVDKDTKVTRFGVAADANNVLIKFKEGRYTNKAGCTFKQRVYTEEEYQRYLDEKSKEAARIQREYQEKLEREQQEKEAQRLAAEEAKKQEIINLIQDCFWRTENYFSAISTGNEEGLKQLAKLCSDDEWRLMEMEAKFRDDYVVLKKAREVVTNRGVAVRLCLNFKIKGGSVEEYHQKAEQARQEFRDKYGY